MKLLFLILLLLSSQLSWGYANFIGHGYTSCINCHFNPFGNGILTDYGRVVDATAISSKVFYPKSWDDEKIANASGFLFRKPTQKIVRTQVNYRGFTLVNNPGSAGNEDKQWIPMQFDARLALKFGENDKFLFVGDYGKVPEPPVKPQGENYHEFRSRNLYAGYRPSKKFGIYAGLMDKVYGIRVIEHNAFSRIQPQIKQNDQTIGVAGHFLDGDWEGGVHLFGGNTYQDSNVRQKGGSAMVEKTIFGEHRIGASFLKSKSDVLGLTSYAVHGRFNLKEGSALLAELGQTHKSPDDQSSFTSRYGLLQTYVRPFRGLYVFANIEHLKNDISESDHILRWGPGVQYFPIQKIELRFDIYDTRNYLTDSSVRDSWMYLLQTHIWL